MPTYEYECQACHRRVEAVQRFTDPALTLCEHCGGELRKVFSAVGVVFKGSGFYKTDSRGADKTSTPDVDDAGAASEHRIERDPRGDARHDVDDHDVLDDLGLTPRDGDVVDRHGLTGGTPRQPFLITTDFSDVQQHALERRRDGDLAHRLGQLTVTDHESGHADREVPRDGIDARVHADERLDEDAVTDATKDLGLIDVTGCQLQRATARRRRSGDAAAYRAPVEAVPARRAETVS